MLKWRVIRFALNDAAAENIKQIARYAAGDINNHVKARASGYDSGCAG